MMNPILRKDLLALFRSPVAAAMQMMFVGVLAAAVMVTWPRDGMVSLASAGRGDLLLMLVLAQMWMFALFIPGAAAMSIVGERVAGTIEMLYSSRLGPLQIALGKIGSVLAFPAILLLSASPFFGFLSARGDVESAVIVRIFGVLLLTAVFVAMISLAISSCCRQASTALVLSYVSISGIFVVTLVPAAVMLATQEGSAALFLHALRGLSPLAAVFSILQPQPGDFDGSSHGLITSWKIYVGFASSMIVLASGLITAILCRVPNDTHRSPRHDASKSASRDSKLLHRPLRGSNPVFGKERRTNRLGSTAWVIRCFYGSLVLSLLLAAMSLTGGLEHPDVLQYTVYVLVCLQVGLVGIVAPALTSSSIVSEHEDSTFDALRMTLLRPGQIFWGKLITAMLPGVVVMLALIPAYAVICLVNPIYLLILHRLMAVISMMLLLCCVVGQTASVFAASSVQATVLAYATVLIVVVLPALAWWLSGFALDRQFADQVAVISPLVTALGMLPGAVENVNALLVSHLLVTGIVASALLAAARWRLGRLLNQRN